MFDGTLVLSGQEIRAVLSVEECIAALREAHAELAMGDAVAPLRTYLQDPVTSTRLAVMPALLRRSSATGAKLLCVSPSPRPPGRSLMSGVVVLHDAANGRLLAIMEAGVVTEIRTASASAIATDYLARQHVSTLAILGAGRQGRAHVRAITVVRPITDVRVWSPTSESSLRFKREMEEKHGITVTVCAGPEEAIQDADVVCTTSLAREPIVHGGSLPRGVHINAVGAHTLETRELDSDAVAAARVYVDSIESITNEGGDIMIPIREGRISFEDIVGELGDLVVGRCAGRLGDDEVTLYKSVGMGLQDLAAAVAIFHRAVECGAGTRITL